jgi:membrane protease YdiL (CAAX protease family)
MGNITKFRFFSSFAVFFIAGGLMFFMIRFFIPFLTDVFEFNSPVVWFIIAGLGIFVPIILFGFYILWKEGYGIERKTWVNRLRFRKLTGLDLLWTLAAFIFCGFLTGTTMNILRAIIGEFSPFPEFIRIEEDVNHLAFIMGWIPFFFLNIIGEEFTWRGVVLPGQEKVFGKYAWLIHGAGWTLFHLAFGWKTLVVLTPMFFVLSYVVQRRQNSWIGVIIHGGLNAPGFILLGLGY